MSERSLFLERVLLDRAQPMAIRRRAIMELIRERQAAVKLYATAADLTIVQAEEQVQKASK